MRALCEHPDCIEGATMVISCALGSAAVCDQHREAVAVEHGGQAEFAEWYRDAALASGPLA